MTSEQAQEIYEKAEAMVTLLPKEHIHIEKQNSAVAAHSNKTGATIRITNYKTAIQDIAWFIEYSSKGTYCRKE